MEVEVLRHHHHVALLLIEEVDGLAERDAAEPHNRTRRHHRVRGRNRELTGRTHGPHAEAAAGREA